MTDTQQSTSAPSVGEQLAELSDSEYNHRLAASAQALYGTDGADRGLEGALLGDVEWSSQPKTADEDADLTGVLMESAGSLDQAQVELSAKIAGGRLLFKFLFDHQQFLLPIEFPEDWVTGLRQEYQEAFDRRKAAIVADMVRSNPSLVSEADEQL